VDDPVRIEDIGDQRDAEQRNGPERCYFVRFVVEETEDSPDDGMKTVIEARLPDSRLEAACGLLLSFLLPPGKTGFVFWRQLFLLHRLGSRLGSRQRSFAA